MSSNRRILQNEIIPNSMTVGQWPLKRAADGSWRHKDGTKIIVQSIHEYLGLKEPPKKAEELA